MASLRSGARQRLMQELAGLQKEPWVNIEVRNLVTANDGGMKRN